MALLRLALRTLSRLRLALPALLPLRCLALRRRRGLGRAGRRLADVAQRRFGGLQQVAGLLLGGLRVGRVAQFLAGGARFGRHAGRVQVGVGVLLLLTRPRPIEGGQRLLGRLLRLRQVAGGGRRGGLREALLGFGDRGGGGGLRRGRRRLAGAHAVGEALGALLQLAGGVGVAARGLGGARGPDLGALLAEFLQARALGLGGAVAGGAQRLLERGPLRIAGLALRRAAAARRLLQLRFQRVAGAFDGGLVGAGGLLLQLAGSGAEVELPLLVAQFGLQFAGALRQFAEVELARLGLAAAAGLLVGEALLEARLVAQKFADALQPALQEGPSRAGLPGVGVRLAALGVAQLLQRVEQPLFARRRRRLHRLGGAIAQRPLALLQFPRRARLLGDLREVGVEARHRLAFEQDVDQAFEVGDDFLLLAQRLGVGAGGDVVADAGDFTQHARSFQVCDALLQQLDLLGLLFALVALLQALHHPVQSLGLAQDLFLVAAQPLHGFRVLLRRALLCWRRRRREREQQGRAGPPRSDAHVHHLPRRSLVRSCTSRCRSRRARTSCTRSW